MYFKPTRKYCTNKAIWIIELNKNRGR